MKHIFLIICFSIFSVQILTAQNEIKLWPNGQPGNNECPKPEERYNGGMVRYVSEATITLYLPEKSKNTGAAIIICAGGGYGMEAITYEGYDYAEFLQHNGIAGIVIKYRLPYGHSEIPLLDVQHAIRTARYNAEAWGIDSLRVVTWLLQLPHISITEIQTLKIQLINLAVVQILQYWYTQ